MKKYMKSKGTIHFTRFNKDIQEGNQGDQLITEPFDIYALGTFLSGAQSSLVADWPDSLFSMDINRKSTAVIGETVPDPVYTVRETKNNFMYLKNVTIDYQLQNLTTNPVQFTVYWCLAKSNTTDSPYQSWLEAISLQVYGQSQATPRYNGNPTATSGNPVATTYGNTPTSYKLFRDSWKVLQEQHFVLEPGARCKHDIYIHYNILASQAVMQYIYAQNEQNKYVRGISIVPLVVAKGFAQFTADANNAENPDMTYSTCKYGWVTKEHYTFVPVSLTDKFPIARTYPTYWANSTYASAVANEKGITYQDPVPEAPVKVP